jgi:hypothetical protein
MPQAAARFYVLMIGRLFRKGFFDRGEDRFRVSDLNDQRGVSLRAYPKNLRHGMPLWAETFVHVGFPMPTDARPRRLPYADSGSEAETFVHVGFPMPTAGAARFWDRL